MNEQFMESFVYVTPLTKPYLDYSNGVIKVKHTQEANLYEKLSFKELEKGDNYVNKPTSGSNDL